MIEHERSFVFRMFEGKYFVQQLLGHPFKVQEITDYYLNKHLRVRHVLDDKESFFLTKKEGIKKSGQRLEHEIPLEESAARLLMKEKQLVVNKIRNKYKPLTDNGQTYDISFDELNTPMQLGIFEVESVAEVKENICEQLFGKSLISCDLSIWDLAKRRIGICGTSSSGKSESAKYLSNILNTKYKANSFHIVEYATTFIQKYNRIPELSDQFFVWHGQREREENAKNANVVISDCPTFLSYIYIMDKVEKFDEKTAMFLSKMYKRVLFDTLRYTDIVFLELQEYKENGVRYQSLAQAKHIEERIRSFLSNHKINHITTNCFKMDALIDRLFFINSTA